MKNKKLIWIIVGTAVAVGAACVAGIILYQKYLAKKKAEALEEGDEFLIEELAEEFETEADSEAEEVAEEA